MYLAIEGWMYTPSVEGIVGQTTHKTLSFCFSITPDSPSVYTFMVQVSLGMRLVSGPNPATRPKPNRKGGAQILGLCSRVKPLWGLGLGTRDDKLLPPTGVQHFCNIHLSFWYHLVSLLPTCCTLLAFLQYSVTPVLLNQHHNSPLSVFLGGH